MPSRPSRSRPLYVIEDSSTGVKFGIDSRQEIQSWHDDASAINELLVANLGLRRDPVVIQPNYSDDTTLSVSIRDIVGWLSIHDRLFCVAPKFADATSNARELGVDFLPRYLAASMSGRYGLLDAHIGAEAKPNIADLFASAFLNAIEPIFRSGLAVGYEDNVIHDNRIEGRVLPEEYGLQALQNPAIVPQVVDRLQRDIPLNRLFKWAISHLLSFPLSSQFVRRLSRLQEMFGGVSAVEPAWRTVEVLTLTPSQAHFEDALELARVLYRGRLTSPSYGDVSAANFAFLGWHVFQEFCDSLLSQLRTGDTNISIRRGSTTLASATEPDYPDVTCKPDFRVCLDNKRIVLDAKYKTGLSSPSAEDASQVIAAGLANEADAVALVYPVDENDQRRSRAWQVKSSSHSIPLFMLKIDPFAALRESDVESEARSLGSRLRQMLE